MTDVTHCANCNGEIFLSGDYWLHKGTLLRMCKVQPEPLVATPQPERGWTR